MFDHDIHFLTVETLDLGQGRPQTLSVNVAKNSPERFLAFQCFQNLHAPYIPMDKVGGDFYDLWNRDGYIELFIADDTGAQVLATTAHLTLVALDEDKKPAPAPPLRPETAEEKQRYENARLRVQARKERLKTLHESGEEHLSA